MNEIDILDIRKLVTAGSIIWTEHLALRLRERDIKRADVVACLQNGKIIERYPDDLPFQSCLVSGKSVDESPLHVVCSLNYGIGCCIITAYRPSSDKWLPDNTTRKVGD